MKQEFVTLPREAVERAIEALKSDRGMAIAFYLEISALRAALDQPQNHVPDAGNMVPAGWKLVPIEPTDDMLYDIQEFSHIFPPRGKRIWAHMLAAAPQPPTVKECLTVEQQQGEQEPVPEHKLKDVRCECCGYMTNHREHMGCIRAAQPKHEPLTDEQIIDMADELQNSVDSLRSNIRPV